jgi:hypothetical protein
VPEEAPVEVGADEEALLELPQEDKAKTEAAARRSKLSDHKIVLDFFIIIISFIIYVTDFLTVLKSFQFKCSCL